MPAGSRSTPRPSRAASAPSNGSRWPCCSTSTTLTPWLRWDRGPGRAEPGGARRHGRPAALLLRHRDLAAGGLLPDRPPDPGRLRPVPRHLAVRPALVRLRLPADGVDRPVHAGGALDRGRSRRAHPVRQGTLDGGEVAQARAQARRLAADRVPHRRRLDHVLPRRADRRRRVLHRRGRPRRLLLRLPVHRHHLPAGRHGPRAGLHLHVPVAADPGRPGRPGHAWLSPTRHGAASRGRKYRKGDSFEGRGDCIDCRQCVAVCPMGIDIRDGFQLECIGCGLCIDACDEVMDADRPPAAPDRLRQRAQPGAAARRRSRRSTGWSGRAPSSTRAVVAVVGVAMLAVLLAARRRSTSTSCPTAIRCSSPWPTAASATATRSG